MECWIRRVMAGHYANRNQLYLQCITSPTAVATSRSDETAVNFFYLAAIFWLLRNNRICLKIYRQKLSLLKLQLIWFRTSFSVRHWPSRLRNEFWSFFSSLVIFGLRCLSLCAACDAIKRAKLRACVSVVRVCGDHHKMHASMDHGLSRLTFIYSTFKILYINMQSDGDDQMCEWRSLITESLGRVPQKYGAPCKMLQ